MSRHVLVVPLLVASLLRLSLMLLAFLLTGTAVMTQGDTQSYQIPGQSLLFHGSYTSANLPELDRTPGYPIFLMLTGAASNHVLPSIAVQIAISLGSLWLIWRITTLLYPGSSAPIIAAWIYAIEPVSILYAVRLMPETIFVFFLLLLLERLIAFQQSGKLVRVGVAGVFLAAATYVRPVSYYLVLPIALGLIFTSPKVKPYWWKAPALLILTVLPLLAIWQIRNITVTGYRGFSSIVEKNLYFYQSAEVTAELKHRSLGSEQKLLGYPDEANYFIVHPEQKEWSQVQRLIYMRGEALQILKQHPELYLRSHFAGVAVVAFTPCASEWLQMLGLYPEQQSMPRRILNEGLIPSIMRTAISHPAVLALMALLEVALLTLYAFAIRGYFASSPAGSSKLLLAGIFFYFLIISGGAQAVGRYRLPAMPVLCILAAGGISNRRKVNGADQLMMSINPTQTLKN